jgi:hypothetical protein
VLAGACSHAYAATPPRIASFRRQPDPRVAPVTADANDAPFSLVPEPEVPVTAFPYAFKKIPRFETEQYTRVGL